MNFKTTKLIPLALSLSMLLALSGCKADGENGVTTTDAYIVETNDTIPTPIPPVVDDNESNGTNPIVQPDTTPPIITLNGATTLTIELGSAYTELGATTNEGTLSTSGTVNTAVVGSYTITYSAIDSAGNKAIKTRTVNVVDTHIPPPNQTPTATPQNVTVNEDSSNNTITLAGLDSDGNTLSYTVETQPSHGTLSGTAPNLTYTPTANYNGDDSFSFKVNDGLVDSATATVSITVSSVNDTPTATPQSITVDEDSSSNAITLAGVDSDGDTLSYTVETQPSHGTLSGTAPNLTYVSTANYYGDDNITFTVNDGTVDSATATVSITVNSVNDAPVANAGADKNITVGESVELNGTATDDGTIDTYTWSLDTDSGYSATSPNITVPALVLGTHIFTLAVMDDGGEEDTDTVTVIVKALPIPLKKTGQTKSYDTSGTEITDGSVKDDGHYQKGTAHSYTRDNAYGIVTDNVTGLMWQDDSAVTSNSQNWTNAGSYCSGLTLGIYDDWRLPTIEELVFITDKGKATRAINDTFVYVNTSSRYWSATTYASSTSYAWVVLFNYGSDFNYGKSVSNYVRCVRGGQ